MTFIPFIIQNNTLWIQHKEYPIGDQDKWGVFFLKKQWHWEYWPIFVPWRNAVYNVHLWCALLSFICSAFPLPQAWACNSKRLCSCSPYSWHWESEVFGWWTVGHQESVWFCATSLWQTYLKTKLQQITFTLNSIELTWHMRRSCGMALILTLTVLQAAKAILFRSFWYSFHAWTEEWYFFVHIRWPKLGNVSFIGYVCMHNKEGLQ